MTNIEHITIGLGEAGHDGDVSAIMQTPANAVACFVFAHGAGAGMDHPFMASVSAGLALRRIATLRFQFPYMEQGTRRPDPPKRCHVTIRAAVAVAHELLPSVQLFAGGKSFGGRMTSQAQAASPLPHVRGLCFLGFPLHTPKEPSLTRARHLSSVSVPMLFLQGTRDAMADPKLLQPLVMSLGSGATLEFIDHADHSFHVLVRSGTTDQRVLDDMLDVMAAWISAH